MQQLNLSNNDEISLRELIETLIKGRKIIAITTVLCLLFSGIFSFFIQEPVYEAKTILLADSAKSRAIDSDTKPVLVAPLDSDKLNSLINSNAHIDDVLASISPYPTMNVQTYKEQLESSKVIQQVINKLELGKYDINRSKLRDMLELETIKDTNLITIKVKNSDPKLAADIANALTEVFAASVTEMTKEHASESSKFLKEQLEVEKKNLDDTTLKLKEFLSQPKGVNELKQEFDSKLALLTTFKTQLVEKEIALSKAKAGLAAAQQELKNTSKVIVTKKSVGQDPLLSQIAAETNGTSIKDTAQLTMESEEINEGYINLSTRVSDYKIAVLELSREIDGIKTNIDSIEKELESIQVGLADKEHNQTQIQRNVDMAQETYDAFLSKYEEIRIAESTELGSSTIKVVSQAAMPEEPTGPRKLLNLAIAGVLGIIIGVFVAFFKEYWKSSGKASATI